MVDPRQKAATALAGWLAERGEPADVAISARATVGLSQETWFGTVARGGTPTEIVLRLPTPASGRRAIVAQRMALQSLAGSGLPVPSLLWHDDTAGNAFGRPFIVMARVPGAVPVGWHELTEPRRTALAQAAIDALADLHAIDVARTGLAAAPPSPFSTVAGLRRMFGRLGPLPVQADAALWWLERREPPPPAQAAIVHGDFRMGNLAIDGDEVTGILDWEMAAPGDPLADLVWCFMPVWQSALVNEAPLFARYAARRGITLDPAQLQWHSVAALLRLVFYAYSGTQAFDQGQSSDLRLAALRLQLPARLQRLAQAMAGVAEGVGR